MAGSNDPLTTRVPLRPRPREGGLRGGGSGRLRRHDGRPHQAGRPPARRGAWARAAPRRSVRGVLAHRQPCRASRHEPRREGQSRAESRAPTAPSCVEVSTPTSMGRSTRGTPYATDAWSSGLTTRTATAGWISTGRSPSPRGRSAGSCTLTATPTAVQTQDRDRTIRVGCSPPCPRAFRSARRSRSLRAQDDEMGVAKGPAISVDRDPPRRPDRLQRERRDHDGNVTAATLRSFAYCTAGLPLAFQPPTRIVRES